MLAADGLEQAIMAEGLDEDEIVRRRQVVEVVLRRRYLRRLRYLVPHRRPDQLSAGRDRAWRRREEREREKKAGANTLSVLSLHGSANRRHNFGETVGELAHIRLAPEFTRFDDGPGRTKAPYGPIGPLVVPLTWIIHGSQFDSE